jgi:hypothetical protein
MQLVVAYGGSWAFLRFRERTPFWHVGGAGGTEEEFYDLKMCTQILSGSHPFCFTVKRTELIQSNVTYVYFYLIHCPYRVAQWE